MEMPSKPVWQLQAPYVGWKRFEERDEALLESEFARGAEECFLPEPAGRVRFGRHFDLELLADGPGGRRIPVRREARCLNTCGSPAADKSRWCEACERDEPATEASGRAAVVVGGSNPPPAANEGADRTLEDVADLLGGADSPMWAAVSAAASCRLTKPQVAERSEQIRAQPELERSALPLSELLPLVAAAAGETFGYRLRPVQLAAIALLTDRGQLGRGLLAEMKTGEGKSAVIACVAALQALRGHRVDVFTSSPTLAKRELEESSRKPAFFQLLKLTASHNIRDEGPTVSEPRLCYLSDIVYGTVEAFCFDVLGEEYSKKGNMNGRTQSGVAIVDEVDSMFVDRASSVCRLSSRAVGFPGFDTALTKLWQLLVHYTRLQRDGDSQVFVFMDARHELEEELVAHIAREWEAFLDHREDDPTALQVGETTSTYLKRHVKRYVRSALVALFTLKRDKHYVIINRKVVIVDNEHTGVALHNTQWSHGMHQFVELKEGLPLSPFTLESNFLSTASLFRRYGSRLCGLSGTLGSSHARDLLAAEYGVECVDVPTNKPCRRVDLPLTVVPAGQVDGLVVEIVRSCLGGGRPVLVICPSIGDVRKMESQLRGAARWARVRALVLQGDVEGEALAADGRTVLVSTNLLGRGADILVGATACGAGGLHVIVTSRPQNKRVLLQAFGRAGRCGQPGSAQLILGALNIEEGRHEVELDALDGVFGEAQVYADMQQEMAHNRIRDAVFVAYLALLDELPLADRHGAKFKDVEERFAYFYATYTDDPSELQQRFAEFAAGIRADFNTSAVQNPGLMVRLANESRDPQQAVRLCEQALRADARSFPAAHQRVVQMLSANRHDNVVFSREQCRAAAMEAIRQGEHEIMRQQGQQAFARCLVGEDRLTVEQPASLAAQDISFNVTLREDGDIAAPHDPHADATTTAHDISALSTVREHGDVAAPHAPGADAATAAHDLSALRTAMQGLASIVEFIDDHEDIADVGVNVREFSNDVDQSQAERLQEDGVPGPLEPVKREKPKPSKSGFWAIVVGCLMVAGGVLLTVGTGGLGIALGMGLMHGGVKSMSMGVESLRTGNPIDFKNYLHSVGGAVASTALRAIMYTASPLTALCQLRADLEQRYQPERVPLAARQELEARTEAVVTRMQEFRQNHRTEEDWRRALDESGLATQVAAKLKSSCPAAVLARIGFIMRAGEEQNCEVLANIARRHFKVRLLCPLPAKGAHLGALDTLADLGQQCLGLARAFVQADHDPAVAAGIANTCAQGGQRRALYEASNKLLGEGAMDVDGCTVVDPVKFAACNLAQDIAAVFAPPMPERERRIDAAVDLLTEAVLHCMTRALRMKEEAACRA